MRRCVLPQFRGSGLVRQLGTRRGLDCGAYPVLLNLRHRWTVPALSVAGVPLNAEVLGRQRVDVRGVAYLAHEMPSSSSQHRFRSDGLFASYALSGSVKQMRDAGLVAFTLASSRHSHCVPWLCRTE